MQFTYNKRVFKIEGFSSQDSIYQTISRRRTFYEIDLLEYMRFITQRYRTKGCVCVDVGANIGNHSIFFGAFLGDHVISIEPNKNVVPILKKNLAGNIDNCTLYECALGEKKGAGKIIVPECHENNIGMTKVEVCENPDTKDLRYIEIMTLDSVIDNHRESRGIDGDILLIKIDVEGMESEVLKGAHDTIAKHKPHLFIEAADRHQLNDLKKYLVPLGYQDIIHWSHTPVYHFVYNPSLWFKASVMTYKYYIKIKKETGRLKKRVKNLTNRKMQTRCCI